MCVLSWESWSTARSASGRRLVSSGALRKVHDGETSPSRDTHCSSYRAIIHAPACSHTRDTRQRKNQKKSFIPARERNLRDTTMDISLRRRKSPVISRLQRETRPPTRSFLLPSINMNNFRCVRVFRRSFGAVKHAAKQVAMKILRGAN